MVGVSGLMLLKITNATVRLHSRVRRRTTAHILHLRFHGQPLNGKDKRSEILYKEYSRKRELYTDNPLK